MADAENPPTNPSASHQIDTDAFVDKFQEHPSASSLKGDDGEKPDEEFLSFINGDDDDAPEKNDADIEEAVPASAVESDDSFKSNKSADSPTATAATSEEQQPQTPQYKPSLFTNDRGNLKIVAFVVRNPCLVFSLIITICIVLTFLLIALVFRTAENGNPFTIPVNEFDMQDVRSIQYDSFRLARDKVKAAKKASELGGKVVERQSELADIAMWVFESETPKGVFGSASAIEGMKDAFDIFMDDPEFEKYCVLDYRAELGGNETERDCQTPLTPLAMYYASEWDGEKAAAVIEELKDPSKVDKFNELALCYIQGIYCDLVDANSTSTEDIMWAMELGANISSITSKWDMGGESMVENYTQVTELASFLIEVDVFKGFVDFGFDKGFSAENPVSQYSRGIVFWGGPLEDRNQTEEEAGDEDANKEVEETEGDQRKE